ncbi:methyltransferase [Pseudoalteromonas sp. MSK9-3]|uniref:methyltransferase n=1 Tax=Pseudoalteromonas sp. MSK9-3 TaxID=1897633 RepID=UPI000E6C1CA6|nr:methyltransferase [Pseudoalteromonas sp. MSK9-3]RJE77805.1 methyltransferase [Pseudoalteromonas sp. MSK9-3]
MSLLSQFQQLDTCLTNTRDFWQRVAFDHLTLPFSVQLNQFLLSLDDAEVARLDADQTRLYDVFSDYIPGVDLLAGLTALPYNEKTRSVLPFWLSNGIKGRKLTQLQDFVSHVPEQQLPVLEWCAGKGHLGRLMAHLGAPSVHSIELQSALCEQGAHSAKQQELNVQFSCANVLTDNTNAYFKPQQHAVALHACGALHQTFMHRATEHKCEKISLSPCCYHLFTESTYQPMSEAAKHSALHLSHSDMKLALQETVTAAPRIATVRRKEVTWRLGFDALRRDCTGSTEYISVPSVNKSIFSGDFSSFCCWAAAQKDITLPSDIDYASYLEQGEQRKRVTDRIELVRHVFRRALEIWLVLDRGLYLQQAGYDVSLSEFCEKQLTPRNVLIQATRQ